VSISSLFRCPRQRYHYTIAGQQHCSMVIARDNFTSLPAWTTLASNLIGSLPYPSFDASFGEILGV